ncbi:DUF4268 domain-containing protein [candidate division GN15 bacterium]|uniref:DUF4268 domain-containing protein n=1 Tax=candidate division GN15 bacterium TaxID=2072418 RepID=A0A855WZ54_9BACT|nr:MAG: DUF4268 domain-containing protein [candidate division GN15 bacterium]
MKSDNRDVNPAEIVPIRDVFKKEATHFTTWLEQHIDSLAKRLGMEFSEVQREQRVGDFIVDLLCEDGNSHKVVIENQLERTNHDHLGKLLTYLVNLGAGTAIWISSDPRPEHERVIDWLNESTPSDISFYLVKVEGVQIGGSKLAPFFSVVSKPDRQSKEIGESKKNWAERQLKRDEFWKGLLERSRPRTKLFGGRTGSKSHYISASAGKRGMSFNYVVWTDSAAIELYIDADKGDGSGNLKILKKLMQRRAAIERKFGAPLEWQELEDRRASRVRYMITAGGLADVNRWPALQDRMIDAMIRFESALRPWLAKLV